MCNYAQETASIHTKDQFTPKKADAPPAVAPFGRAIPGWSMISSKTAHPSDQVRRHARVML
jgi:hypothetical protein